MSSSNAIVALIRKDVLLFLKDKRALFLSLVMPVILAAFFGFLTGGGGSKEAAKIKIALVVEDQHVVSQKVVAGLKSESSLDVSEMSLEQAQEQVRKGKLAVAVRLPSGFGKSAGEALFGVGKKADLPVLYDPSQATTLAMVKGMLTQQVMQVVSAEMFSGSAGTELVDRGLNELGSGQNVSAERLQLKELLQSVKRYQQRDVNGSGTAHSSSDGMKTGGLSMPFSTSDMPVVAKDSIEATYNGYAHSFAGMVVQFILFMAIDVGVGVLMVRKLGIWNRMLAAPISVNTIITARMLSSALIAAVLTCMIFVIAMVVFKVQILGSSLGFVAVVVTFSLMTASFGLLIAAFGKTPEAARGISIFATLVMVMLGGAWLPSFLFPAWLQQVTVFIPTRWAVDGFDAMTWRGLGLDAALPCAGALLAFAFIFFGLAQWKFKRTQMAM